MNAKTLAEEIRKMARGVCDDGVGKRVDRPEDADVAELLRVLARIVEGKHIGFAFGAPGDWGYGTPIGDALAAKPEPLPELSPEGLEKLRRAMGGTGAK